VTTIAAGELVARVLRAAGTDAVYGQPLAPDASSGSP